jgi:TolB-like protein
VPPMWCLGRSVIRSWQECWCSFKLAIASMVREPCEPTGKMLESSGRMALKNSLTPKIYALGPFRLDTDAEIVYLGAEPMGLGRRAVAVLRALVEQPGIPVSKDALIAAVWPDRVVEEANLTVQIGALRRALGKEPGGANWIETLSGRGYRFIGPVTAEAFDVAATRPASPSALAIPDKPSIAVLPFQNMSDDPDQEYFADGMVEEIITALSRFQQLFVIARNSSFAYKGRVIGPKQIGRELGVRYVLEGSIRRSGPRVRITAQLVEAASEAHLWADRFDDNLENIFDLQDRVTSSVVGAIAPELEFAEIRRAQHKTESLDAYDCFLRGLASFHPSTKTSISEALRLFHCAIDLDPQFAAAYGMAAWCHVRRKGSRWATDPAQEAGEAARLVGKALEFGRDDAVALASAGYSLAYVVGDLDQGSAVLERAVAMNPNFAAALSLCGWPKVWLGQLAASIDLQARAMRLSPRDPQIFLMESATAFAHLCSGQFDEASAWAARASNNQPNFIMSPAALAASNAHAGRGEEAHKAMVRVRQLDPSLCISSLAHWTPFQRPEHAATWADGLRKAGLPE